MTEHCVVCGNEIPEGRQTCPACTQGYNFRTHSNGNITPSREPEAPMNRSAVLDMAKDIITHDRNNQYGEPENSFDAIAEIWTGYLHGRELDFSSGDCLTEKDVACMMVGFKLGRSSTQKSPKIDTYVDMAGYAAIAAELEEM